MHCGKDGLVIIGLEIEEVAPLGGHSQGGRSWMMRRKSVKINIKKIMESNLSGILGITILICFVMIMFGVYEELVIPFFVIGRVAILGWLAMQGKKKR